jgi:hypothetical protein
MSMESEFEDIVLGRRLKPIEGGRSKPAARQSTEENEEESCRAFGYLRGLRERAQAVQFHFRDGNSLCLAYHWLGGWQHNPSVGLLLKFTGDVVTLVLIRGSNLGMPVKGSEINLTDRGLQRHRITYVREMDEDELAKAGEDEPTIDAIEAAAFDSQEKLRQWVSERTPAFLGGPLVPA